MVNNASGKIIESPKARKRVLIGAGLLTIVGAVAIAVFTRWVQSYDRVFFPAVEASRSAGFTNGFIFEGWILAIALVVAVTAALFLWLRFLPQLVSLPISAWFALSIGLAFPVGIYTSPTLALPFVASALAAMIVVLVRHRSVSG